MNSISGLSFLQHNYFELHPYYRGYLFYCETGFQPMYMAQFSPSPGEDI